LITRREAALGGLLTIVWNTIPCACHARAADVELPPDCTLDDQQAEAVMARGASDVGAVSRQNPVIVSSGDRELDYAVAQNLSHITDTFGVLPGFAYYDDGAQPNAFATRRQFLNRSDGTVFFGRVLLSRCLHAPESPDAVVSAVCAHEFGHVVQFKYNLQPRLLAGQATKKRVELNADFMAGYYAGRRKLERPTYPSAVYATAQYAMGDTNFNGVNHHGTPEERAAAVVKGFEAAYREKRKLEDAVQIGFNYALTL
jgi:hypothetical protein